MQRRHVLTILTIIPVAVVVAAAVRIATRDAITSADPREYEADGTVLESSQHGPELCLGGVAESYPPQCGGIPITNWRWDDVDTAESANGTTWASVHVRGTYDGERFTLTAEPGPMRPPPDEPYRFGPACDRPEVVDERADGSTWGLAGDESDVPGLVAIWVSDPQGGGYEGPFLANVIVRPGSADEARAHIRRSWKGALCIVERDQRTAKELDADHARLDEVLTQQILTSSPDYMRGKIVAHITVVDDQARREVDDAFGPGVVELTGALKPI